MKPSHSCSPISFKQALGKVIPLCLVALLMAGILISIANDTYAFVKPDRPILVDVAMGTSAKELCSLLQDSGVIKNSFVFRLYLRSRVDESEVLALSGSKELNSNMSYREIFLVLF